MNSFFSALAGVTVGLIGVISAFLISKILTREEKFLIIEEKIKLAFIKAEGYKQVLGEAGMESFIENSREEGIKDSIINTLDDSIKISNYSKPSILDDSINIISNLFFEYFSIYDDFNEVSNLIDEKRNYLKKLDNKVLTAEIIKIKKESLYDYMKVSNNFDDSDNIFEKYKIEISEFIKKTKFLSKKTNGFRKEKKQINFFMIIVTLFFIVGIIYPLSFVKYSKNVDLDYSFNNFFYEINSISGIILLIISLIFLLFIVKIFSINNKLDFPKEKLEEFNKIYTFEYYSIYLKNYEDNRIRIKDLNGEK